jgi:hypothetical protein
MNEDALQSVADHCAEIGRCNQRGGRTLSIVDLLEAETMPRDIGAYCIAAVSAGHSILVGASSGGAGKTTVMGALLTSVPRHLRLEAATPEAMAHATGLRRCRVCHEVGPGPFYAYLWGEPLRTWFRLAEDGAMLASNLHADTMDEVRQQVVRMNAVSADRLRRIGFVLFLSVRRAARGVVREVSEVYESDGVHDHVPLWSRAGGGLAPSALVTSERLRWASDVLDRLASDGARTIEDVRSVFLEQIHLLPEDS